MSGFVPDLDRSKMGSPDRVDALVWALTELCVQREKYSGLMEFYRSEIARASWQEVVANG